MQQKVQSVLEKFPSILQIEKQIELLKPNDSDDKLVSIENDMKGFIVQISTKPAATESTSSKDGEDTLLF